MHHIGFHDRLLTEAVRHYETGYGVLLDEPAALSMARASGGDLESRLIIRAGALSIAPALKAALDHLRQALILCLGLALLLAVLGGVGAARIGFWSAPDQPINVYWLLISLLGPPLLTLLLWLILLLLKPPALAGGSLGGWVLALARQLSQRLHHDPVQLAAARASATVLADRWTLSAISHALWLSYLGGALGMALVLLSVRQYGFVWESTLLSTDSYAAFTEALAWLPGQLGFATPDATQIAASRRLDSPLVLDASGAWSGLVLGCLVVYGILPRLLLLLLCLMLRRRFRQAFRLDIDLPGHARLHDSLQPLSVSLGVIDTEQTPRKTPRSRPTGRMAMLGLETDTPSSWPPLPGDWEDLGQVDDRAARQRVLDHLQTITPARVVVVCSLAMTPDRGHGRFLEQLVELGHPLLLVLSEGQRMRIRGQGDDLAQRLADWRTLAAAAGLDDERILELDLEHLTAASRSRLAAALGLDSAATEAVPIQSALALIVEHAERWQRPPGSAEQAELHRAIARLHGRDGTGFRLPMPTLAALQADPRGQIQQAAERVRRLLPLRLRGNPRWLAAGALSGALGCIAIATVTTPVALSALPLWTAAGATLSLFITPDAPPREAAPAPADFSEAVAAAALFSLLLDLQDRDEVTITRALDELLEDHPPTLASVAAIRAWLDDLTRRHHALRERLPA